MEYGAQGSMGRKGAWGGREYGAQGAWGGREYGADGSQGAEESMGRKGLGAVPREYGEGPREPGAEGTGRKGSWGGREYGAREYGAEESMGRAEGSLGRSTFETQCGTSSCRVWLRSMRLRASGAVEVR